MNSLLVACLFCLAAAPCSGQSASSAPERGGVSFEFTPRPDAKQAPYVLSVNLQGEGRYIEFPADPPDGPAARPVLFKLTSRTLQRLLSAHDDVVLRSQQGTCGTRLKNIASTGKKTVTFYDGDKSVACVFDHSDDPGINGVADGFQAIAETLQYGERLENTHRFDRLGLDALMDSLVEENRQGRAIEMQVIATTLQSILDDDHVIERARRKAARLLQDAAPPPATLPSPSPR